MHHDLARYREVISYARFSTPEQSKGASTERQSDAASRFAAAHNIELSPRSCLDAGLSGYHGDHIASGAFGALLDSLASGIIPTPTLLLVEAADRFGRLPSIDALKVLFDRLFAAGCDLYLLDRNLLVTAQSFNTDLGTQIVLLAELHAAHAYSARLSERLLDAHARGREAITRREPVRRGWAPRWIDYDDDTASWRLNDYATTVNRLLTLLEGGLGQWRTAQTLNDEGLRSPRGGNWTPGTVAHIAYSPAVAGGRETQRRTGEVVWDYFPEVWPRPRWEALRQELMGRDRASGAHGRQDQMLWVGQGITRCICGANVGARTASQGGSSGTPNQYLRCRARLDRACDHPALRLRMATAHLLTRLAAADLGSLRHQTTATGDVLAELQQQASQAAQAVAEAQAMLTVLEEELSRAAASEPVLVPVLARQIVKAEVTVETLDREHMQLLHQVERAQADATTDQAAELQAAAQELLLSFASGADTPAERKAVNGLLRRLGVRITVDGHQQRMGLAVGDTAPVFQPVHDLALSALQQGATSTVHAEQQVKTLADVRRLVEEAAGQPLDRVAVEVEPGKWVDLP